MEDKLTVESDHKPSEVIVKKPLHRAPKSLQRMFLRIQAYSINLGYTKGSKTYLADALSRAYLSYDGSQTITSEHDKSQEHQHDATGVPKTIHSQTAHTKDESPLEIIKVIKAGWPEKKGKLSHLVLPYFGIRDELSIDHGVVVKGERLVVPKSLLRDLMRRRHYEHLALSATFREQEHASTCRA